MTQTISKAIGESLAGKGELYAALAYDTSDKFGGYQIKSICLNWASYEDGDGRVCFYDEGMYIAPYTTDELDIVADDAIWLISDDIYLLGNLHFYGDHGEETSTSTISVILTDPTTAANALYGYIDAGATWTSGNMVGVRGKVAISYGGVTYSATGVWAGLNITSASVQRLGLQVALNAEAYSNTVCLPNAIVYIQSLPSGSTTDFSAVPYLVFSETVSGSGTGSNILFEVGHNWAQTVPTLTSGTLFYGDTLQIAVNKTAGNRTAYYIPLSTAEASFTTAYPIITTYATTAITIGTCVTGIQLTNISGYALQVITDGRILLGTVDVGLPLATSEHGLAVHCEPAAMTEYTSSFGIRSRYHISNAQTAIITCEAVDARMRIKAALTLGIYTGVQGYVEVSESPTLAATQIHAGGFTVEVGAGTTLSSGYVCGVHIDSATADSVSVASVTYAALRISTGTSSKEIWTYGIYMADDDVVTGMTIGDCTTAINIDGSITTGINIATGCTTGIAIAGTGPALTIATTIGNSATIAQTITVTDSGTLAAGRNIGLFVDYVVSGTKTGSFGARSTRINTQVLSDCDSVQVADWYLHTIADKTIDLLFGLTMYWEDIGDNIANACMIDLGKNMTGATSSRDCFIRCREHTGVQTNSAVLQLEGDNAAHYLVVFGSNPGSMDAGVILETNTDTETSDYRVMVKTTQGDRYIYLYPI